MRKSFTNILIQLSVLLFMSASAQAQSLFGKVTDAKGEPLIGVTIQIQDTKRGTTTDVNGLYKLENLNPGTYTVIYSYIGFEAQRYTFNLVAGKSQNQDIILKEDAKLLSETVVIGYGVQRRREVTGSVTRIGAEKINDMPAPSFEAMLQGKAPGVQVITGSGLAGSGSVIRIRGIASLSAGGDPLYVIDGIPITQDYFLRGNTGAMNNNPLATINPDDIESIDILKDAAATAIYGSRGANGVILVSTKRGKSDKWKFDFNVRSGVSTPTRRPRMLNSDEFLQLYQEAWENDGNTGLARLPGGITWEQARRTNTDWVDQTIGIGFKQTYNFGASKATNKYSFYGNLSYDDNGSYLIGNSYKRFSSRVNYDRQVTKNLKAGVNLSYSRGRNDRIDAAWSGGLGAAMSTALPIFPIKNDDGTWFTGGSNPVRDRTLKQWRTYENRLINGAFVEYTPIKNLILRAQGSYDYMDLTDFQYEPRELINTTHAGMAKKYPNWVNNYNYVVTANYQFKVKALHHFSVLAGHEYQRNSYNSMRVEVSDMTGQLFETSATDSNTVRFGNPKEIFAFLSYFGRVNYAFNDKYFVQLTARVDGSSRFGINNRYGLFPAASMGWIMSNEDFMKGFKNISYAKIRASIGRNGNANLPNYQRFGTYSPPGNQVRYNGEGTIYPTRLENPNLRWETSTVIDLSFELGLYKDRITTELSFYNKNTKDVLAELAVPRSTGFSTYWDNVGQILNRGVEFAANAKVLTKTKVKWDISFNIARNYNEVLSIGPYSEDAVSGGTNDTRVVVGKPVGTNFLVRFSHIDPQNGRPVYFDLNGNQTYTWDPAYRVPVGAVLPDAIGGITNTLRFGRWDVMMLWVYTLGGNIYESSAKRQLGVVTDWNMRPEIFDRWRQPGDQAAYPRLTLNTETYGSGTPWINTTVFLHDATFARLRNLTVSYNAPEAWVKKLHLSSMRFQIIGTNLITLTKFQGLDPEIARDFENATDRNMSSNITFLTPPQERTYNAAIQIKF